MRVISLLAVATFFAPNLGAQQPGERVRLTMGWGASSTRVAGMLVSHDADSFWVQLVGRTAPVSLARSAVARLEVGRGQRRAVGQGALIAAGLGAIGGFVAGGYAASRSRSCGTPGLADVCYVDWYGRAFRGALIGGTIGGAVGAAVGYAVRTDRWEGMPLSRAHHLALVPRGPGLALTF